MPLSPYGAALSGTIRRPGPALDGRKHRCSGSMHPPVNVMLLFISEVIAVGVIAWLLRRLVRLRRERNELLQQKDVVFNFVYDVGEVFAGTDSVELSELLKRVLSYALRTTRGGSGALYIVNEENGDSLHAGAVAGIFPPIVGDVDEGISNAFSKVRYVEKLVRAQSVRVGEGLVGEVAAQGMPMLIEDAENDPRVPSFQPDFLRVQSMLLVPLRFHQQVLGVMVVVNRIDGKSFTDSDTGLLQALVDQAAVSVHYARVSATLDEKRRLDRDLTVARQIQTALLPKALPCLPGVEIAAFSLPAQLIGGDYYDFVQVDESHLGIAIADVSGKGIAGAIVMSICRSLLRIKAPGCLSPADVLLDVNRIVSQDIAEDMFISMLYLVLDLNTLQVRVARAGHMDPIVHPGQPGEAWTISSSGIAIGLADTGTFDEVLEEGDAQLQPGDTLVLYTDGVTEAQDRNGKEWGVLNMVQTVETSLVADGSSQRAADEVRSKLTQFVGGSPQYDDMTLVLMRIEKGTTRRT